MWPPRTRRTSRRGSRRRGTGGGIARPPRSHSARSRPPYRGGDGGRGRIARVRLRPDGSGRGRDGVDSRYGLTLRTGREPHVPAVSATYPSAMRRPGRRRTYWVLPLTSSATSVRLDPSRCSSSHRTPFPSGRCALPGVSSVPPAGCRNVHSIACVHGVAGTSNSAAFGREDVLAVLVGDDLVEAAANAGQRQRDLETEVDVDAPDLPFAPDRERPTVVGFLTTWSIDRVATWRARTFGRTRPRTSRRRGEGCRPAPAANRPRQRRRSSRARTSTGPRCLDDLDARGRSRVRRRGTAPAPGRWLPFRAAGRGRPQDRFKVDQQYAAAEPDIL